MRLKDSLIKRLDGLIQDSNSLIKLLDGLIQDSNKILNKTFLGILVLGSWRIV